MKLPQNLNHRSSWPKFYYAVFFDWAIIVFCWWMMTITPHYYFPLWGLIIAGRIHGFGAILHDLCHLNLKNKNFHFRFIEFTTGYFIGKSANAMAYHHLKHHTYVMTNDDPYFKINKKCSDSKRFSLSIAKGIILVPFWIVRTLFSPVAILIPSFRNFFGSFFLQDTRNLDLTQDKDLLNSAKEDIPVLIFHICLLIVTMKWIPFLAYGYYLILPGAGILCIYRLLIEHQYDEFNILEDLSKSTVDHHTHIFDRILIGPHNIGYHYIHHLHPGAGFTNLPLIKKWYQDIRNKGTCETSSIMP